MCLMRIIERLIEIFIRELEIKDRQSSPNLQPNFLRFLEYLEEAVGLVEIKRETNKRFCFRSFTGAENFQIFKYIFENQDEFSFYFGAHQNIIEIKKVSYY